MFPFQLFSTRLFPIGQIIRTHGRKGAVKIALDRVFYGDALLKARKIKVGDQVFRIHSIKPLNQHYQLSLFSIDTSEQADQLKQKILYIKESLVKSAVLNHMPFFPEVWIGFDVLTSDHLHLGKVSHIIYTGSNDVLSVKKEGAELLIPVIPEYIQTYRIDKQYLIVIEPEYTQ